MLARLRRNRHRVMGWVWILLAIPTVIWWKDAIVWVALMSIYANAEASFGAQNALDSSQ